MDTVHQLGKAAAGQVIPADAEIEEGITAEKDPVPEQADAAGTVPGRMEHQEAQIPKLYAVPPGKMRVYEGWGTGTGFLKLLLDEEGVIPVYRHGSPGNPLHL